MKRVLLALCLMGAAVPSTAVAHAIDLEAVDGWAARHLVTPLRSIDRADGVGAVVVVAKVVSFSYASPDTWDELPMLVPPYEQPPATGPAQQLAMSVPD